MSRGADLSLSFSLLLSPSMIPFRSPFPFFSPRKTNYPSDHRLVAGKQETRKKRGERRETFERLIIRGPNSVFRMLVYPNPVISVHCYRYLPWDYTGVNIQGVLLFTGAVRQGSSCDKQRELNSPLHSISSESNLESV